ncbi:lasso peptide biosynthesis PqqD family chaperone [Bacillus sp. JJ1609]|uniref:lasso peptide biosynthesis PqqD family chaperone n=1 Tax=Bacillus sp. JJ1609 TaxID=3122977 RepID=UPI002FFEFD7E
MLTKENILLESKIVQMPGNIVSDMDGEKVMLNIENGNYYNLGKLGGDIWEMVKKPIEVRSIIIKILSEYDVDESECEKQVISFANKLFSEGLITVVNG